MPQMIFDDKMFYIRFYLDVIPEEEVDGRGSESSTLSSVKLTYEIFILCMEDCRTKRDYINYKLVAKLFTGMLLN